MSELGGRTSAPSLEAPGDAPRHDDAAREEATSPPKPPARYYASIYPGEKTDLPPTIGKKLREFERAVGMPLWLLVDNDENAPFDGMTLQAVLAFRAAKPEFIPNQPIALLVDHPGGFAKCSYQLATYLRRHCGGFTAVVPQYAKSAATLLTLGANKILMGPDAELGPLDAQVVDPDREERISALDEVQAMERLQLASLDAVDRTMALLAQRTTKKASAILPDVFRFVSDMMRPLFERIDAVHYTQMARALKVAEEYAIRLLEPRVGGPQAEAIARRLVNHYPDHSFLIDFDEARSIGLNVELLSGEQERILSECLEYLADNTVIGRVKERQP